MTSYAIGIDFGSVTSCVSVVRNGVVETIPNGVGPNLGNRVTASAVGFGRELLVGDAAMNQFCKNYANTILCARRLLGQTDFDSEIVQEDINEDLHGAKVIKGSKGEPVFEVMFGEETKLVSVEEACGEVIKYMRETAETYLGVECKQAVIGIPKYYEEKELNALKKACAYGGVIPLRFVSEAAASVLAYELKDVKCIVYDVGGSSVNATLVTVDSLGQMQIQGEIAETQHGGVHYTESVIDFCIKDFKRKQKVEIPCKQKNRLWLQCEQAKKTVSASSQGHIELDHFAGDMDYSGNITRNRFEELNKESFQECMEIIEELIDEET